MPGVTRRTRHPYSRCKNVWFTCRMNASGLLPPCRPLKLISYTPFCSCGEAPTRLKLCVCTLRSATHSCEQVKYHPNFAPMGRTAQASGVCVIGGRPWTLSTKFSTAATAAVILYLPPGNNSSFTINSSRTTRNAASCARPSERQGVLLCGPKRGPIAPPAARKLQCRSSQRKVAPYYAGNVSSSAGCRPSRFQPRHTATLICRHLSCRHGRRWRADKGPELSP